MDSPHGGPLAATLNDLQQIFGDRLQAFVAHGRADETPAPSLAIVRSVTADDLARHRKAFRSYSLVYPFVWAVSRLDALVPGSGYMLIASARRQ